MKRKLTAEEKTQRAADRKRQKEKDRAAEREKAERQQPRIETLTLTIEWRKSRTYGHNPLLTAEARFKDGQTANNNPVYYSHSTFTCSGCGYDKESTVIADAYNHYLKYKLHEKKEDEREPDKKPYGVSFWNDKETGFTRPYFDGGIGTSCFFDISKYIGGKFEHIASGKTFDVYKYTDQK